MKRVKSINGYTIYAVVTERDAEKYCAPIGSHLVYFSSDLREYGLSCSYAEWDAETLEEAEEFCLGSKYAIAKEIVEEHTTAASYEEIAAVEAKLEELELSEEDIDEAIAETADENGIDDTPVWFAVLLGDWDHDWGMGSYDLKEAKSLAGWYRENGYPDTYILVVIDAPIPDAYDEIHEF